MAEKCPIKQEDCKYAGKSSCIVTKHHLFWPESDYMTPVEHYYRNLPANIELLSRCEHDYLHDTTEPPEKPDLFIMLKALSQPLVREVVV